MRARDIGITSWLVPLALLVGARLALLANDIDVNRLVGHALGLLGLGLLHHLARDEDLLHDTPGRGGDIVQDNAHRHVPTEPDHHDGHDATHDLGLARLRGVGLGVEKHRDEREDAEREHEHQVDPGATKAKLAHGVVRRDRERLKDAIEVSALGNLVAKHGEQGEEHGHLDERRQAASQRVELVLAVELLHLLVHALRIVGVARLNLHELGLQDLHLSGRARGAHGERRQQDTDDGRQHDDGQAPVAHEVRNEREHLGDDVDNPIPHGQYLRLPAPRGRGHSLPCGADCTWRFWPGQANRL